MKESASKRNLAENEVIFRQANEQIFKKLQELDRKVVADGHSLDLMLTEDIPLHFYCECSNDKCRERVEITPSQYQALHKNSSQFVVLPGHQVAKIERVVREESGYLVVEKFLTPPKKARKLNSTDL